MEIEGYVQKKDGFRWRKRYAIFSPNMNKITFFPKEQDKHDFGKISSTISFDKFRILAVRSPRDNFGMARKPGQWGFQVDTEEKSHQFMAPTEADLSNWKEGLLIYKALREKDMVKEQKEQYGSYTLTDDEISKISSCYQPPLTLKGLGFCSVFEVKSSGNDWENIGIAGAVCLVQHMKTHQIFLNIRDTLTMEILLIEKLTWTSEFMEDSDYFHTFLQSNTQTRFGLCFSSVAEAKMFYECVKETVSATPASPSEPRRLRSLTSNLRNKLKSSRSNETLPELSISDPIGFRKGDVDEGTQAEIQAAIRDKEVKSSPSSPMGSPPTSPSNEKPKSKIMGGFIGGLRNKLKSSDGGSSASVSGPMNVKREGHLGFSKEGKMETDIPAQWLIQYPQWRKFLLEVGVKETELKDEKVVSEIMAEAAHFIRTYSQVSIAPNKIPKRATRQDMQNMVKHLRATQAPREDGIPAPPPPPPNPMMSGFLELGGGPVNPRASVHPMNLLSMATEDEKTKLGRHLQDFMQRRRHDLEDEEPEEEDAF
eukprot:TRINITY_DN4199_c0_g1_i1.p1 TRINITY_DN4199_c0_g1~~TRINITY_DN4199_c0_g1_i1.p1  ORF type:complete len:538 (-),score=124.25 TRINITY_DN4199_c0_g1_i1:85-1698(-)